VERITYIQYLPQALYFNLLHINPKKKG